MQKGGAETQPHSTPRGRQPCGRTRAVRASTPGVFITAPAKAEEMYSPETFGRSAGEVVEVVEY